MATAKTPAAKKTAAKSATKKTATQKQPTNKVVSRSAVVRQRVNAVPVAGHVNRRLEGFVDFLREQAVVGLAIGIVIGSQVQTIAKALVNDFINPLVALLMPGSGDLANKSFYIHRTGQHPQQFMWGDFASNVIAFVMIVGVIYFVIKGLKLDKLDKKKEAAK